eukprot:5138028-Pyramimonas_sp.AAC.1
MTTPGDLLPSFASESFRTSKPDFSAVQEEAAKWEVPDWLSSEVPTKKRTLAPIKSAADVYTPPEPVDKRKGSHESQPPSDIEQQHDVPVTSRRLRRRWGWGCASRRRAVAIVLLLILIGVVGAAALWFLVLGADDATFLLQVEASMLLTGITASELNAGPAKEAFRGAVAGKLNLPIETIKVVSITQKLLLRIQDDGSPLRHLLQESQPAPEAVQ